MESKIIWNYEDVHNNILSIQYNKETIGYFRMDLEKFIIITDLIEGPRIPIGILRSIVSEYDEAMKEAKKIAEIE